ncbi:MAG: HD domain-containing protein [Candidatus Woesearchaeota archaeon]
MNCKDKNPDYKAMYAYVKGRFDRTRHFKHGPFDETFYTMRVYECAKELLEHVDAKREQVLVAAILHDIGKVKLRASRMFGNGHCLSGMGEEWHRHAILSVPMARQYLKKQGHSKEFIDEVCYLIEHHDMRGDKMDYRSVELQVIQDADIIADVGFAGFIRPFLFCGKFNKQSIIDSIRFIKGDDRTKEVMNLEVSKKIAKREMKIQKRLVDEIYKEIDSDLLG